MPNNRGKNNQRGRGNQHGRGNKSNYAGPRSNEKLVNGSKTNQSQPCPFLSTNGWETDKLKIQNSSKFSHEELKHIKGVLVCIHAHNWNIVEFETHYKNIFGEDLKVPNGLDLFRHLATLGLLKMSENLSGLGSVYEVNTEFINHHQMEMKM